MIYKYFNKENVFENIFNKISGILLRPKYVKTSTRQSEYGLSQ